MWIYIFKNLNNIPCAVPLLCLDSKQPRNPGADSEVNLSGFVEIFDCPIRVIIWLTKIVQFDCSNRAFSFNRLPEASEDGLDPPPKFESLETK